MDQYASYFVDNFGEPSEVAQVPAAKFAKYEQALPECLLGLWRKYGWGGFKHGLFFLVDPDEYESIGNAWVKDLQEFSEAGIRVFGRSAFGCLYAYHPASAKVLSINCPMGYIMTQKRQPTGNIDLMQTFFAAAEPSTFDLVGADKRPLFDEAVKTLGSLKPNEVYGFEPLLALGGMVDVAHLRKMPIHQYLEIIGKSSTPSLRAI